MKFSVVCTLGLVSPKLLNTAMTRIVIDTLKNRSVTHASILYSLKKRVCLVLLSSKNSLDLKLQVRNAMMFFVVSVGCSILILA